MSKYSPNLWITVFPEGFCKNTEKKMNKMNDDLTNLHFTYNSLEM